MKKITWLLPSVILVSVLTWSFSSTNPEKMSEDKDLEQFAMADLMKQLESSGRRYLPFLKRTSLHCGIYRLEAGADDKQQPHSEDEVYYVLKGEGRFTVGEEEIAIKEGDVLFVAANAVHRFHDIEEDLELLVFFSTGPTE